MISWKPFTTYEGYLYRSGFATDTSLLNHITKSVWSPVIWRDGKSLNANFLYSDYLVLDFDSPETTILDIDRRLCDTKRLIGTTRSHQVLKGGVKCDRFRLVIPWQTRVTDYEQYNYNLKYYIAHYGADEACADGARIFFPCKEIAVVDTDAEYKCELQAVRHGKPRYDTSHHGKRIIPQWCLAFIDRGVYYNSRNMTVFQVVMEMFKAGFNEDEIEKIIKRSPISWHGVSLRAILKNARGKV